MYRKDISHTVRSFPILWFTLIFYASAIFAMSRTESYLLNCTFHSRTGPSFTLNKANIPWKIVI